MTAAELTQGESMVTTSFTVPERFLDRVRELAQRRNTSVSKVITSALQAELTAAEIGSAPNGHPQVGSGWERYIASRASGDPILPFHERGERVVEVRRYVGSYIQHLGGGLTANGVPLPAVLRAMAAFDAELARGIVEWGKRGERATEEEEEDVAQGD